MTYGEQSKIAYSFLDKLRESECPEEDLEQKRIITSFIASLSEGELQEFHQVYEKLIADERFKDQKTLKTFEDYIYGNVLKLQTDVKTEYLYLKNQVDDLFTLIEDRRKYLESRLSVISDKKSSQYKKIQDLLEQTGKVEKEVREQSKTSEIIHSAVSNSQNTYLHRMFFWGRKDFSWYERKIHFQNVNVRKYINFGLLPVSQTDEIMSLRNKDYNLYLTCFEQVIREYGIVDRIKASVNANPLMKDRAHIVDEAVAYFEKADYQLFAHIIVPQIEGFFKLYMEAMHIHKQTQSIGDVVDEINDKDNFLEYLYFKYDFSDIRNPIAHGDVINPKVEQAYEILMDLHWIVSKFDSEERDYKKWMSWLEEFSTCADEDERRKRILDYFNCGMEEKEKLDNLRLFLSHQYSKWIEKYDLLEAGKQLSETLSSKELYTIIWNESMPLVMEDGEVDEELQEFLLETVYDDHSEDKRKFRVIRRNIKPLEYENFVELMFKHRLCPDDWYAGYKDFVEKQELPN